MKTGINGGFYYRGGSMLRVFRAGDRLLPVPMPFRSWRRGDGSCFLPPGSRTRVVHRIVGCGENSFRTQGDNNARPDRRPVTPEQMPMLVAARVRRGRRSRVHGGAVGRIVFRINRFRRFCRGVVSALGGRLRPLLRPFRPGLRLVSRAGRGLLYAGDTVAAVRRADGEGWRLRRGWRFFYSADELNRLYPVPGDGAEHGRQ